MGSGWELVRRLRNAAEEYRRRGRDKCESCARARRFGFAYGNLQATTNHKTTRAVVEKAAEPRPPHTCDLKETA